MRRAAVCLTVLALAGCGGAGKPPPPKPPPHIPHALAHTWAAQAQAVAHALAAGDGCTAEQQATALRQSIAGATTRIPVRYRATLTTAADALPGRIACTPAPPEPTPTPPPAHHPFPFPHPPRPPRAHWHGPGHGRGER